MEFSMYEWEDNSLVEGVKQFQYLGRTLKYINNEWPEFHRNIGKARSV